MKTEDPCIVCLKMDALSFQRLTAWRKQHFPPERNFLDAHLTLYHRLPFPGLKVVRDALSGLASRQKPFDLPFEQLSQNGSFLGIKIAGTEVVQIKQQLDKELTLWLAPQDRQKIVPHVTVMNNAPPDSVLNALGLMQNEFTPWVGRAEGFQLFRYRQGPWEWLEDFSFAEA